MTLRELLDLAVEREVISRKTADELLAEGQTPKNAQQIQNIKSTLGVS